VRAKLSAGDETITVRMLDVSEGGLGVMSPVEITEGNLYRVEFVFPTMQDVFRTEVRAQSKSGFRYGFEFVGLDEQSRALLLKYQRRWGVWAK
jgi:hypothetical protein